MEFFSYLEDITSYTKYSFKSQNCELPQYCSQYNNIMETLNNFQKSGELKIVKVIAKKPMQKRIGLVIYRRLESY